MLRCELVFDSIGAGDGLGRPVRSKGRTWRDDEPLRLRVEAELREQGLSVAIDPASIGRIAALLGAQDWRKREGDWWGCLLVAAAALGGYAMAAGQCRAPSRPLGGASGQVSKACPFGPGSSSAAQGAQGHLSTIKEVAGRRPRRSVCCIWRVL